MDEMRQWARIVVKVLPQSMSLLPGGDSEANYIGEKSIKKYIPDILGADAPQPDWGLAEG